MSIRILLRDYVALRVMAKAADCAVVFRLLDDLSQQITRGFKVGWIWREQRVQRLTDYGRQPAQ